MTDCCVERSCLPGCGKDVGNENVEAIVGPNRAPLHLQRHIDIFSPQHTVQNEALESMPAFIDDDSTSSHGRTSSIDSFRLHNQSSSSPLSSIHEGGHIETECLQMHFPNAWTEEDEKVVRAPYEYVASLPQKSFRDQLVAACNGWFQVSDQHCGIICKVVGMLHNASLMIDDIQDGSTLRRGQPVAHLMYGIAQTINSANYMYFEAQAQLLKLPNWENAVKVFEEEMLCLHRGQGMELYWRDTFTQPTLEQYLLMISNKTGGLFRLVVRLLHTTSGRDDIDLIPLINVAGLIFQILDDYKNFLDCEMIAAKGYCEDLTEGKFSFPIIHGLSHSPPNSELANIFKLRTTDNSLKAFVVRYLEHDTGSFAFTRRALDQLHARAAEMLEGLEISNRSFAALIAKLREQQDNTFYRQENHGDRT